MRFHIRSLFIATLILAAWLAVLEFSPLLAGFVLALMVIYSAIVPVLLIVMGLLAAPQKQNQLDVGGLPYFNALARVWVWCLMLTVVFYALTLFRIEVMR